MFIYHKDPFKSKYEWFIKGREQVVIENLKNPNAFVDYSQTIDGVYENLEDYGPTKERRVLIIFDDMIADIESNTKLSPSHLIVVKRAHLFLYQNLISKHLKL